MRRSATPAGPGARSANIGMGKELGVDVQFENDPPHPAWLRGERDQYQ
jgi:hypothetical protein